MFKRDIEDLIQQRTSIRKYSDRMVDKEMLQELLEFAKQFDNDKYTFQIVDYSLTQNEKISTYGLIQNAKTFVVGIGSPTLGSDNDTAISFGADFEKIILKATELGMNTCWLGMSYSEDKLRDLLKIGRDRRIVMASPLGYSAGRRGMEKITRFLIKADQRIAADLLFFENEFGKPLRNYLKEDYKQVLEMVRLAPSAGNSQPWRVVQSQDGYDFYVELKAFYDRLKDKRIDFAYNDMGIAKMHFEETAKKYHLQGSWVVKDRDLIRTKKYVFSWKVAFE